MAITVDTKEFKSGIRRYAIIAGKSILDAVKEEAKLIAQGLVKFTPPKKSKAGKDKIKSDIERVYLNSSWFLEDFTFTNQKLGEKVKGLVRAGSETELDEIFQRSDKLRRIHIESLDESTLSRFRKNGKVPKGVAPYSYPLTEQKRLKSLIKEKQKNSALVKAAWAACVKILGGSAPAWLDKGNVGTVQINEKEKTVTLINHVSYAASLDGRGKFSAFVLRGRDKALSKKIEIALSNVGR